MRRFLLPLLLNACGPGDIEYQDHWSSTHELCAFADTIQGDRWSGYDALFPDVTEAFYPSEACVDAVLNDFSADVDSLLELDGLETPYDAVHGGRDLFSTRLGVLLASARALLLLDYGTVGKDLVHQGPISEGYVQEIGEAAEESGVQDLGGAIYNFASSVIESMPIRSTTVRSLPYGNSRRVNRLSVGRRAVALGRKQITAIAGEGSRVFMAARGPMSYGRAAFSGGPFRARAGKSLNGYFLDSALCITPSGVDRTSDWTSFQHGFHGIDHRGQRQNYRSCHG